MTIKRAFRSALIVALGWLLVTPAAAQVATADITGRVADQSGAAVAGATVTARNQATGLTRSTVTSDTGSYTITQLPPGSYEVSVESPSFTRALVRDFPLYVGTRQTLNIDLRPGVVTETLEVTAGTLAVESTKSDISGVVTPHEVSNLPLLNRTFAGLAVVIPEARPVGNFDPTKTRIGSFAMSGGDGRQLDVNVDGGSNKDNVVGSLVQNFPYESIQEFQVQQHRWSAETGRAVGGVVNMVTKSGTNDLRGSFFAQFRDEALVRKDYFEVLDNREKTPFSRQEFGGSLGGPIVRNRLFFFGALERFRERQSFAIPASRLAQIAAIPGVTASPEIPQPYDDWLLSTTVDHKMTDRQTMFYRFAFQDNSSPNDQVDRTRPSDLQGGNTSTNRIYSFVASHAFTVSPTLLNKLTFHYQDFANNILGVTDQPNILFPSVQSGANGNVPQQTLKGKIQFRNDLSMQKGRHGLRLGGDYIYTDLGGFFNFGGVKGYQIQFFSDPLTIRDNLDGRYPQGFATPGAVQAIRFFDGHGAIDQTVHQLAFYLQDDFRMSPRLTLNLGLRWDATIGILNDQTNNRAIRLLQQLNHPLANAITGDPERLSRSTPSLRQFQPRVGFAWDPSGAGRTVVRGGYGIFFDQIFQNLTLFSLQQSNPTIFQQVFALTNSAVGVGELASFRFGVDPLPPPPPNYDISDLAWGAFGRINDPNARDPYVQKFSVGFETTLGGNYVLSSDFVHTLGLHEGRVQVINPQIRHICDPAFPSSTPGDAQCVRGANSRRFDLAFLNAGFELRNRTTGATVTPYTPEAASAAARLDQINMIGTTNRSLYDSWATTIRRRSDRMTLSASYILASSRSWGGQPTASYSGNGIAIVPEYQFRPEEYGPTRLDERHRVVLSGVFELPFGVQLSPILQVASARPYSLVAGFDVDGDGQAVLDRLCQGVSPQAVFEVRGNLSAIRALNPFGCTQAKVNSVRGGFRVKDGQLVRDSGRFFNVDLRAAKSFRITERLAVKGYADVFNLFNTTNLNYGGRLGLSPATSAATFMQPAALFGPGFGPPVGRPLTAQLGFRIDF